MGEHPIENLMNTAMNSIKDMIDVNTIIGEPIQASNNTVIIPISKVGFGFAAGGSEFRGETIDEYTKKEKEEKEAQLEEKMDRWVYLNDLAEQIEAQKNK